jgi:hypothetical protein
MSALNARTPPIEDSYQFLVGTGHKVEPVVSFDLNDFLAEENSLLKNLNSEEALSEETTQILLKEIKTIRKEITALEILSSKKDFHEEYQGYSPEEKKQYLFDQIFSAFTYYSYEGHEKIPLHFNTDQSVVREGFTEELKNHIQEFAEKNNLDAKNVSSRITLEILEDSAASEEEKENFKNEVDKLKEFVEVEREYPAFYIDDIPNEKSLENLQFCAENNIPVGLKMDRFEKWDISRKVRTDYKEEEDKKDSYKKNENGKCVFLPPSQIKENVKKFVQKIKQYSGRLDIKDIIIEGVEDDVHELYFLMITKYLQEELGEEITVRAQGWNYLSEENRIALQKQQEQQEQSRIRKKISKES